MRISASKSTSAQRQHSPLLLLLAVFLILTIVYARATPPLEASDELWHMGFIIQLATNGELPVQNPAAETIWEQEGSQPPLYYAIVSQLVRLTGVPTDFEGDFQHNPHSRIGVPTAVGNKNIVLHPVGPETTQAVFVGRAFSIFLGLVTLTATYFGAEIIGGRRIALLAVAIAALNPMFIFITASVNNDNLVTALNSVIIYLMLLTLRDGFHTRRSLLIAVLTTLSKLSGLVLVPVLALTGLIVAYRKRDIRGLFILGGAMALIWGAAAGWWYLRNIQLYGELFGTSMMAEVAGLRPSTFTFQTLIDEFESFRIGYWGWFGGVNIITSTAFYVVMDIITVLAVFGVIIYWVRNRGQRLNTAMLMLSLALASFAVINWTIQTYASQGRLLFPYIAATATLFALGLSTVLHRAAFTVPLFMGIVAVIVPFTTITPAYAAPTPIAALPASAQPVYARYGDIEFIGYETPTRRYQPGESIPVTLYWRVTRPSEQDMSLWLHAYVDEVVGKVDSYPGGGALRTTTWPAGIYADHYAIMTEKGSRAHGEFKIQVGWWHYPTGTLIQPVDEAENTLDSVMLEAGTFGTPDANRTLENLNPVSDATFAENVTLLGYRLEAGQITLLWQAISPLPQDYTIFIQVLDSNGTIVSQGDGPPDMPAPDWMAGERFTSTHQIDYTEGQHIALGWYSADGARLPINAPDNAYLIR